MNALPSRLPLTLLLVSGMAVRAGATISPSLPAIRETLPDVTVRGAGRRESPAGSFHWSGHRAEARSLLEAFRSDWSDLFRLNVNSTLAARAERPAWEENLRGYDAVQLASALVWKEHLAGGVTVATFDVALWEAAGRHALGLFPEDLPDVLDA